MTMKITKRQLRTWKFGRECYDWFLRRFPDGVAEYQYMLNAMVDDDRADDAFVLMSAAGPDRSAVLEVERIEGRKHFFAAGRLVVKAGITVSGCLCAGGSIESGEGIQAGTYISAGSDIGAGWDIRAGMGLSAGGRIRAGNRIEAGMGISAGESIVSGGGIHAGSGIFSEGCIHARGSIVAGAGIRSGGCIQAGVAILAGEGICAVEATKAGVGYGIFAGCRRPIAEWPTSAQVVSKIKPNNLISGSWVDPAAEAAKEMA